MELDRCDDKKPRVFVNARGLDEATLNERFNQAAEFGDEKYGPRRYVVESTKSPETLALGARDCIYEPGAACEPAI